MSHKSNTALILAHGNRPSYELLLHLSNKSSLFLATDGAANELAALGLFPNVVFGDFDSLSPSVREKLTDAEFVHSPDQEASDLDKAISHTISLGFESIYVAGATGGRLDHTLANTALLLKYHPEHDIRLIDDRWEAWAVSGIAEIGGCPGDTVSLVAFVPVESVSISGVRWPLNGEALFPGSRGVSNEMISDVAKLEVKGGTVIVIHQPASDEERIIV
jgi:thiamine pyrophosphokinase